MSLSKETREITRESVWLNAYMGAIGIKIFDSNAKSIANTALKAFDQTFPQFKEPKESNGYPPAKGGYSPSPSSSPSSSSPVSESLPPIPKGGSGEVNPASVSPSSSKSPDEDLLPSLCDERHALAKAFKTLREYCRATDSKITFNGREGIELEEFQGYVDFYNADKLAAIILLHLATLRLAK
jgi:hypothetical protein